MAAPNTRPPTATEKRLMDDILQLYQCKPSDSVYANYSPDAVFHDPVSIAKGLDSIKSQFNGMPKLFAESVTKECGVMEESTPSKLALNLTQHYVFKSPIPFKEKGTEKTVNSKVTLHLNSQGLIEKHDEEWDHAKNKTGDEDGFIGKLMEARKKAGAKMVEKTVPSDPSKV